MKLFEQLSPEEMTPEKLLSLYNGNVDAYFDDVNGFLKGGVTEITDAPEQDSPSRNNMAGNHLGQSLPTVKTGKRRYWNGPERDYGLYGMEDVKVPDDAEVLSIVSRYPPNNVMNVHSPYEIVFYYVSQPGKKAVLSYFSTKEYGSHTINFGYKLDFNHVRDQLRTGGVLSSDFPVGRNTLTDLNGDFQYGHEVNVLFSSSNWVSEDQYRTCKETSEDLFRFYLYNQCDINYRSGFVALNTYGNQNRYQPCPLPGQDIRKDGILMAFREKDKCIPWLHLNREALLEINYDSDRITHVEAPMVGLGRVYDVEVTRGRTAKAQSALGGTTDFLNELADLNEDFYARILDAYHSIMRHNRNTYQLSDDLTLLIAEAYVHARRREECRHPEIRRLADKMLITDAGIEQGDFNIRLTCVGEKNPHSGDKYTDTSGTKGISARPTPRDEMPFLYLPSGRKVVADFELSWLTVIKRMNTAQFYTFEVNYYREYVLDNLKAYYDKGDWEYCDKEIHAMYHCVHPKGAELIALFLTDEASRKRHVDIVMNGGLVFYNPNQYTHRWLDKVKSLRTRFPYVQPTDLYFTSKVDGKVKKARSKGKIAMKTMVILEKHPDIIAVSTSLRQHHGQPATTTKLDRTQHQVKKQACRGISETEGQLYTCTAGPKFTAESFDRTANVTTNAAIVDALLSAVAPTNVECLVNRMEIPLGNSNTLSLLKNKFSAMGFSMKQV